MKQRICPMWKAFLLFLMFLPFQVYGQVNTITGTVTDKNSGTALPGVTIVIKGTATGTVTDIDGTYSIKASPQQVLTFSFIGYSPVDIAAGETNILDVQMTEETQALDEVMVIGYGTQKKSDKTGAVAQISADEMTGGVLTDPLQAIQGQVAGVMITKKGGDPNAGFAVKIRGASGFDSNTQPLYVVDGVSGVDPTTISPEDIETFNILKDAASTAIYGSQGSNGVIIITTKSGKGAKDVLQLNVKVSVENAAKRLDLLSAEEIRDFVADHPSINFIDGGASTDWQDEIFRTGISTEYNLNYTGGNDKTSYYVSGTQAQWTGILKGTEKQRSIGKINLTQKALNDKLVISSSLSGTFEKNDYEDYNGYGLKDILYQAYSRNPTDPVKNPDGSYYQVKREFNYVNPVATLSEVQNLRDAKRFYGNIKADLTIINGLVATLSGGYTRDDSENQLFEPRESWATTSNGLGKRSYDNRNRKLLESYLTYSKSFEEHNLNLVAGHSWQETNNDGFGVTVKNANSDFMGADNIGSFVLIDKDGTSSYRNMSRLIGFFGRGQYNYSNKYYLSGSIRRDGSTKFGANNKWGWFPTAAAAWTISKESFMENLDFISNLKLRTAWGISGNQEIGEYRSRTMIIASGTAIDPETGNTVISFPPDWNYNPDLKWESTSEINIGLDYGLIKNRISGSIEIYKKTTKDLLGQFTVPVPPNVAKITWGNSGRMENKGVELSLQVFAVDHSNFKWKTNLTASHNKQTMLDLGGLASEGLRQEGYISGRGLTGSWVIGILEGESLGSFYVPVYAGLVGGKMVYKSKTGGYTDIIADAKREIVGSALPDLELGWSNYLTFFKNWNLDFTFRGMYGNKIFNATRMLFDYPGDFPSINKLPEAIDWYNQGRKNGAQESDYYVEDASFLRMDYLALTYNVKQGSVKWLSNLRLSVAANNLFILTNYSGVDPETSITGLNFGIDQYNTYPKTRSFTFGINATF